MNIILRPTGKDAWAGIFKYRGCNEYIGPTFTRTGRLYTGLTKEDEIRLGEKLGFSLNQTSPEGKEFWESFSIRTSGKDVYLYVDDDPMDELKWLYLKGHKNVMNGVNDRKPGARFMLINQEEEAVESNKFNRIKRRAIIEFNKLTTEEMRKVLRIFGHNAENMTPEVVENKLMEIVEGNPEKFLDNWVDNSSKDTDYLIKTAISKNILRKNKTIYKYGTDVIGYTLEDAISYLDNPEHSDIKLAILKQVNTK